MNSKAKAVLNGSGSKWGSLMQRTLSPSIPALVKGWPAAAAEPFSLDFNRDSYKRTLDKVAEYEERK